MTKTIKITNVSVVGGDQPVIINYDDDNGKPYKPGKSMRRVLVNVWGPDGSTYIGRSLTLYGDPKVVFGGLAVGGIRISHMSHIDKDVTMALTATRANRKPFTVKPLQTTSGGKTPQKATSDQLTDLSQKLASAGYDDSAKRQSFVHQHTGKMVKDLTADDVAILLGKIPAETEPCEYCERTDGQHEISCPNVDH